jgi:Gamma-glutamyl cyclotransferase, AIG2-like
MSPEPLSFFFFGTLMDRDVLEIVLGRAVAENELAPARLGGYRRVRTASRPYPMLRPDPDGVIEGMLLIEASSRDEARILHFESEEYVDRPTAVRSACGQEIEARVFFALASMGETEEPWEPGSWASRHKSDFLRQCREWMRDCPI